MLFCDIWYRIVFYCNGSTRRNLSFLDRSFRVMITTQHIHLLKQERSRLFNLLILGVNSSTIERFVADFQYLKKTWKPPKNKLFLNYVDYHYHMLYIVIFLIQHYDVVQLFFHFTNLCNYKNISLVIYLIEDFSTYSHPNLDRLVNNFVDSTTYIVLSESSSKFLEWHYKIFKRHKILKLKSEYFVDFW